MDRFKKLDLENSFVLCCIKFDSYIYKCPKNYYSEDDTNERKNYRGTSYHLHRIIEGKKGTIL